MRMRMRREGAAHWEAGGVDQTATEVSSSIRRAAQDVDEAKARLASLVALRDAMKRCRAKRVRDLPESVRAEHRGALRDSRWI